MEFFNIDIADQRRIKYQDAAEKQRKFKEIGLDIKKRSKRSREGFNQSH